MLGCNLTYIQPNANVVVTFSVSWARPKLFVLSRSVSNDYNTDAFYFLIFLIFSGKVEVVYI